MACFAAPYGRRYAAHCFNHADAQKNRPALIQVGGKLGEQVTASQAEALATPYILCISIDYTIWSG
ncbi:MAG: hypothetical protein VYB54_14140, partial [Pseudomonadota bacterium]|nr:hypothetical protein [Pseudomonadota bacterium]